MKKIFTITHAIKAFSFIMFLLPSLAFGQIAAWDCFGQSSPATFAATTFNAGLVATSTAKNITRGSGAAVSSASNSFRTTGFKNDGIATINNDYFQITLTANSCKTLSLSSIDAKFSGTATFYAAPGVSVQFAYSLDGINFTLIGSPTNIIASNLTSMPTISLTGIPALQNVPSSTTVTMRFYASGQTATGGFGFGNTSGFNGLAIGGTVASNPYVAVSSTNWTSPTTWGCPTAPIATDNVTIPMGMKVVLDAASTVNNLTFTGGGKVTLGANNLTVNGTVTGNATDGYVVTDGTGALTLPAVGAATVFPIGASDMSYDKVTITNTAGTSSFSASVKPTFTITNLPSEPLKVFSREWNITSASTSATLAFTPDITSTPSPAPTVVTLGHYVGGVWVEKFAAVSSGTYSGLFTSFSPFGVGQNGSFSGVVLSSELTQLTATANKASNLLSWTTASEKNNALFNIERSQNGETFTKIGELKGSGTSNVTKNYQFTDAKPVNGINYYRLRQVDFDGTETISKTVSVNANAKGQNKFKVYPTLVNDNVTVELSDDSKSEISVRDLTGRVILTQNISNPATGGTEGVSTQILNLGSLSSGLYLLSVRSNDSFETVKIQKY
jgi:Secretion system C-terminal sorting domain